MSLSWHTRSSQYCSDAAKVNGYPVIHVNADDPEVGFFSEYYILYIYLTLKDL